MQPNQAASHSFKWNARSSDEKGPGVPRVRQRPPGIPRASADGEDNRVIKIIGKGATGTGATGHDPKGPNRTELRRAFNTVTSNHGRWFCYVFDAPPSALPLEGSTGNGDSGGPALIEVDGQWRLAGLVAWKFLPGDVRTARPGQYGHTFCNVRLSHYSDWIEGVMSGHPSMSARGALQELD